MRMIYNLSYHLKMQNHLYCSRFYKYVYKILKYSYLLGRLLSRTLGRSALGGFRGRSFGGGLARGRSFGGGLARSGSLGRLGGGSLGGLGGGSLGGLGGGSLGGLGGGSLGGLGGGSLGGGLARSGSLGGFRGGSAFRSGTFRGLGFGRTTSSLVVTSKISNRKLFIFSLFSNR
jgi:hypothetical protein